MTDAIMNSKPSTEVRRPVASEERLRKRYAAERRFRLYGLCSIFAAGLMLIFLVGSIAGTGWSAFLQTYVQLSIHFDPEYLDPAGTGDPEQLRTADYGGLMKKNLRDNFPEVTGRKDKRKLYNFISPNAGFDLRSMLIENPSLVGTTQDLWIKASDDIDMLTKGYVDRTVPESDRRVTDMELAWYDKLDNAGKVKSSFNTDFFLKADSREPEEAGILGAVTGSALTLLITLLLSFPVGVMAAVYLEEFAPKNKWTDLIEVNINNLAAVPSIVFGLLGLAMFLNFFGFPRSAPLVGGMVLALMTLPTIIIAARSALKAVPPSIREAALGLGASPLQVVTHHVLPLAMPGILTGTIIGMAQALGETAPLLMIGMIAFIVDVPGGFTDPATVLPVQIYLWADSPERAFVERTSAAIMVLLAFLIFMNFVAVLLRKKFERRW
ncbi:phosphate ABC transporter permease PstA [Nisaea acidiphila]|uniref:Phosphate transport system permease protein PstA n=1 Tax=Nisaea acidiphila TaxID=1862145 RepID=A0A9J7AXL4_9PROT|nr:phosphate ABC transporter permease PstA [Nisaea acidiphila]UUX52143.1 phosphate ABC transporter permease PstA [Nisaea acidiphila]